MKTSATARAAPAAPSKSVPVKIGAGARPAEALRLIVLNCAGHFAVNAGGVHGRDPLEFVHQARIGLRRLRSALRLVRPKDPTVRRLRREIRWVARNLGAVRDWDISIALFESVAVSGFGRGSKASLARLLANARRERLLALKQARASLRSARHAATLDDLHRWLSGSPGMDSRNLALAQIAAGEMRKRHRQLFRLAGPLAERTERERHQVRIAAKRLRYMAEFFAPLFAAKRTASYLRELSALQDALGTLNDLVTARRLLARLPLGRSAAPAVRRWMAEQRATELVNAQAALERLRECRHFWKRTRNRRTDA